MGRYLTLLAACLMQTCLGTVYGWSTFVGPLRAAHGLTTADTQAVFGLTVAVFAVTMVGAGRLLPRVGARLLAAVGGLLYGAGFLLASRSGGDATWLLLSLGVVGGAGIGCAYVCPLAVCPRLFPEHTGLVTGLSVAGFGAGAMLVAWVAGDALAAGVTVLDVFRGMGIVVAVVVAGGALFLPGAGAGTEREVSSPGAAQGTAGLGPMVAGMFAGTFAGLMVVGNLVPMGTAAGLDAASAAGAVGAFAFGNAMGRVLWGRIYDRVGGMAIPAALTLSAVALALLLPMADAGWSFWLAAVLVGFGFGANFVLYAAHIALTRGAGAVGSLYPFVFLAYGVSALTGPSLGGWAFDLQDSYAVPVGAAVVVALMGVVATSAGLAATSTERSADEAEVR